MAGLGRAGCAAVEALARRVDLDEIVATDHSKSSRVRRRRRRVEAAGVRTVIATDPPLFDAAPAAGCVVKSPGIPLEAPLLRRARAAAVPVIDELELGWRLSDAPMVAVTGTNGKSTVAGLTAALLDASGLSVRLAGNAEQGRPLSAVAGEPADWIVCEVSSYQLEACDSLLPDMAVFTNLTPDHLHRHGSMRRYGELKRRLFVNGGRAVPTAVVDVDDPFGRTLASDVERLGGRVIRVGSAPDAHYRIAHASWDLRSADVELATPTGPLRLATRLPGRHNVRNLAAAVAVADAIGVDRSTTAATVAAHGGPPGRFEHVDAGQAFDVIVDCAHSVDAVEQVLTAVHAGTAAGGRLRVVLGMAGRREEASLRAMARRACELADELILTGARMEPGAPNPALEDLAAGAAGVADGSFRVVEGRREAIATALSAARPGDVVTIVGALPVAALGPDATHDRTGAADARAVRELLGDS